MPRIKDGANAINIYDKNSKGKHWVSLFIDKNTTIYFDSFGIEYIAQEGLRKIKLKSIAHNIFRTQDNDLLLWILLY